MPYIAKPIDRDQITISTLDSIVEWDSTARVIDHFVDCLDFDKLGFERTKPDYEGRPSYDPRSLLKLYLYGYRNDLRSSRKLERACEVNIEVMCISEHPFGTIKRELGAAYFLLKGKRKVSGEFALMATGYNIAKAENMFAFDKLMALVGA